MIKKGQILSIAIGLVSYLLYIWIVFSDNEDPLLRIFIIPFLYFFPELNNAGVGLGGLPIHLFSVILSAFAIPIIFWLIAKIIKLKVKLAEIIIGFLLTAVLLNIVKIIFDLST